MSLQVVIGVLRRGQEVLIAKRPQGTSYAGYWEFPGGKVEPGEPHDLALSRELKEELGITVEEANRFYDFDYRYPKGATIAFSVYDVLRYTGSPEGKEGQAVRWASLDSLSGFTMPAASSDMIEAITRLLL